MIRISITLNILHTMRIESALNQISRYYMDRVGLLFSISPSKAVEETIDIFGQTNLQLLGAFTCSRPKFWSRALGRGEKMLLS